VDEAQADLGAGGAQRVDQRIVALDDDELAEANRRAHEASFIHTSLLRSA
jgi:hypothetical protein